MGITLGDLGIHPRNNAGSFMNTPGYNSGHGPTVPVKKTKENKKTNTKITTKPNSKPETPNKTVNPGESKTSKFKVKIATSNLIIDENSAQTAVELKNTLFDEFCGQEIISIARTDSIDGLEIMYNPISDIPNILSQYSPKTLIALQSNDASFFEKFTLSLPQYLPNYGTGPSNETVYINSTTNRTLAGSLIINFINILNKENAEIEFFIPDTVSDTIYT